MSIRLMVFKVTLVASIGYVCLVSPSVAEAGIQTEQPVVIRKSGGVLQGSAIKRTEPVYPPLAKAAGISGNVVVEVTIGEDGLVLTAIALSGHPLLKDAAVSAANLWQFSPTLLSGKPVRVIGTVTFGFALNHNAEPTKQPQENAEQEIRLAKANADAHPGSAEAHFTLGEAYADYDRHKEAIESYKQAIVLKPDYEHAHSALANAYQQLAQYEDEILAYQNALVFTPNSAELLSGLARALGGRERFSEGIEVQKRVVELRPDDTRALSMLGWFFHNAHRYEEAVAAYKEVIAKRPSEAHAIFNLGAAYFRLGRFDQALAAYQQSLEVNPPYHSPGRAHLQISVVLMRLGRTNDAIQACRNAIETDPSLIDAYCTFEAARLKSKLTGGIKK